MNGKFLPTKIPTPDLSELEIREDIDFYKKNITLAINSNKLNSRQKKEVFLTNIDAIEKL